MKGRFFTLSVFFISLSLMAGCVSMDFNPASDRLDKKAKALMPARGKALVYVVRPGFIGKPFGRDVIVNGKKIGSNCGGYFVYFMARPGKHTIKTVGDNTAKLSINVRKGEICFIEQIVSPGFLKGIMSLKKLNSTEGRKKLEECKLSSKCRAIR